MSAGPQMLAIANPIEHILDVPWRIGGRPVPWMSSQIAVMILAAGVLLVLIPGLLWRNLNRPGRRSLGLVEMLLQFVRVQIAHVTMGAAGDKAVPFLATLFLFLLLCNLLSLVPLAELSSVMGLYGWGGTGADGRPMNVTPVGGTPASMIWVCAAFAVLTFILMMLSGYIAQVYHLWKGPGQDGHHEPAPAGANIWLGAAQWLGNRRWPLPAAMVGGVWCWLNSFVPTMTGVVGLIMWPVLLVLEMIGSVAKAFALCVRLLANMNGGHIMLAVLLAFAQESTGWKMLLIGLPAGLSVVAVDLLELLVAIIQAYIFTFLSALFIGMAVHPQH